MRTGLIYLSRPCSDIRVYEVPDPTKRPTRRIDHAGQNSRYNSQTYRRR